MFEVMGRPGLGSGLAQEPRNALGLEEFSEIVVIDDLEGPIHVDGFVSMFFFNFNLLF